MTPGSARQHCLRHQLCGIDLRLEVPHQEFLIGRLNIINHTIIMTSIAAFYNIIGRSVAESPRLPLDHILQEVLPHHSRALDHRCPNTAD